MKQCPSCGRMIADEARFCTGCGAKAPEERPDGGAERPHRQPARRCAACGAELAEGMAFCVQCGRPVQPAPPVPGPAQQDGGPGRAKLAHKPGPGGKSPKPPRNSGGADTSSWIYPVGIILSVVLVIAIGIGIAYLAMGDRLVAPPSGGQTGEDESSVSDDAGGGSGVQADREDADNVTGGVDSDTDSGAEQEEEETYLALNVTFLSLEVGDTGTLTAETNGGLVTWTVGDGSVLTLISNGAQAEVTALSAGSTTVTAACDGVTARCEVTVPAPAQEPDREPESVGGENPALDDPDGYLLPTDVRVISESELYSMSREEVALARNEIYARHGHIFENDTYRAYFESKSWYVPDPNFDALDASLLTGTELENINTIVQYEERMGWRK